MTEEERAQLAELPWMQSRIPALDALTIFMPDGTGPDPVIEETARRMGGRGRWYPVAGGVRGVMPYNGQPYDTAGFTLEPKGWDFNDCDACVNQIPAMTLCWVTRSGAYYLLCTECYDRLVGTKAHKRPWWRLWHL
jgi:hypothetical protein